MIGRFRLCFQANFLGFMSDFWPILVIFFFFWKYWDLGNEFWLFMFDFGDFGDWFGLFLSILGVLSTSLVGIG